MSLDELLKLKWAETGPERGGLILTNDEVLELENVATDEDSYQPDGLKLIDHLDDAIGTWHTHPGASANLSVGDFETFLSYSGLRHAIVGNDGVRWYKAKGRAILNA